MKLKHQGNQDQEESNFASLSFRASQEPGKSIWTKKCSQQSDTCFDSANGKALSARRHNFHKQQEWVSVGSFDVLGPRKVTMKNKTECFVFCGSLLNI